MQLKKISLSNYRNLKKHTFYFSPFLTLVVGPNSVGKTNLIEAIYLTLSGHGIKEDKQEELMTYDSKQTIIDSQFNDKDDMVICKIVLENKDSFSKRFFLNNLEKRYFEISRYLPPVVLFAPQLIESITSEPSRRRGLFDQMLSACDVEYKKRLNNYLTSLTKRNKLLERPISRESLAEELLFWDKYLVEQADYLSQKRQELTDFFNLSKKIGDFDFVIKYIPNTLSISRLKETLDEQLRRRTTFIGPQRDDYKIFIDLDGKKLPFDVEVYGSRSQQRLALLWVILNQLRLYETKIRRLPVLLLDDIFSELDEVNSHLVLNVIKKYQTIISTNNLDIAESIDQHHLVIKL